MKNRGIGCRIRRHVSRREALAAGWLACLGNVAMAQPDDGFEPAAEALSAAVHRGQIAAAAMTVVHQGRQFTRVFGQATTPDAVFLLASISKPMTTLALLSLCDEGALQLDDRVHRFLPEFAGDGRETIRVRQLLTHISGLPDQLPSNTQLRQRHAGLHEFVEAAVKTPLLFPPGSRYGYSSMGILLAAEIAQRITQTDFKQCIQTTVFDPLGMRYTALGLGNIPLEQTMQCQVDRAAPEAGAGDPSARTWDWNSPYWRALGAPWGGAHGSVLDVATLLGSVLRPDGRVIRPETAAAMIRNQNPVGLTPRGLGWALGPAALSRGCSPQAFGHGGSTGTLSWADPVSDTICVVLTTLPARAVQPHPRQLTGDAVAASVSQPR